MTRTAKPIGEATVAAKSSIEAPYVPERGELIWLDFSPQTGREQSGRRPALVLSPRVFNRKSRLALVCPITSRAKGYLTEVALPADLSIGGVILVDQLRSLDFASRDAAFIENVPAEVIRDVMAVLSALLPEVS